MRWLRPAPRSGCRSRWRVRSWGSAARATTSGSRTRFASSTYLRALLMSPPLHVGRHPGCPHTIHTGTSSYTRRWPSMQTGPQLTKGIIRRLSLESPSGFVPDRTCPAAVLLRVVPYLLQRQGKYPCQYQLRDNCITKCEHHPKNHRASRFVTPRAPAPQRFTFDLDALTRSEM